MTAVQEPEAAGPGPGPRRRVHPLIWLLIAAGILSAAAWIFFAVINAAVINSYARKRERARVHRLRELAEAQELVRAGTGSYWRRDIAGLADLPLIDAFLARADASVELQPWLGYWFRSLPFADERTPDSRRFAILCFPSAPQEGRYMYAITQDRTIWRKKAAPDGTHAFPADPSAEGWTRAP